MDFQKGYIFSLMQVVCGYVTVLIIGGIVNMKVYADFENHFKDVTLEPFVYEFNSGNE